MTIDERVEKLVNAVPYTPVPLTVFAEKLRTTLLEVACDQRHACAESLVGLENANVYNRPETINKDAAHQAIINATIK